MSTTPPGDIVIFWLRRDLRLEDNAALYHALKSGHQVLPVFIFDKRILDELADPSDRRVAFIHHALLRIKNALEVQFGSTLLVLYDTPVEAFRKLTDRYSVSGVYANEDYEPYACNRDQEIRELMDGEGIPVHFYKDHVIFAKDEITKTDGKPYTVFTPYSKKWLANLNGISIDDFSLGRADGVFMKCQPARMPTLQSMGLRTVDTATFPDPSVTNDKLREYASVRNFPAENGTSRLGVHLRFGTISIRALVRQAQKQSDTFLSELIWREFFQQILWHFPRVVEESFKKQYDQIQWRNHEEEFGLWCSGHTGFPIVDAGMRELNETGFMHNRVRMIVASFLTKDLLIDWRWGEAYFAEKLLDFELASNNGNWQWAAGTGCDAAPYFRIFNPETQAKKFDPQERYIRKWVPEYGTPAYPLPIVDHKLARERTLQAYASALGKTPPRNRRTMI